MGLLLVNMPCEGGQLEKGQRHLKRGLKLERKGHYDEAIEEYRKLLRLDAELEQAWLLRGILYLRREEFE